MKTIREASIVGAKTMGRSCSAQGASPGAATIAGSSDAEAMQAHRVISLSSVSTVPQAHGAHGTAFILQAFQDMKIEAGAQAGKIANVASRKPESSRLSCRFPG